MSRYFAVYILILGLLELEVITFVVRCFLFNMKLALVYSLKSLVWVCFVECVMVLVLTKYCPQASLLHSAIPEKLWDFTGVFYCRNMGNALVNILPTKVYDMTLPMKVYDMTVMNPMIASGLRWRIMLLILMLYLVK